MGAQRRSTQSNSLHVGRSEADRRAMPPDEYRSEGTPSLGEGPYEGASEGINHIGNRRVQSHR